MDLVTLVVSIGVPVLVALFYLEGLVVGKLLQPPVVFVGYVTVADPGRTATTATVLGCVLAATVGQWTLYRGFNEESPELFGLRRTVPYLERLPDVVQGRISDRRLEFVERQFDAYGGWAICATNAIPGIRGLMAVVAGVSAYPVRRFLVASGVGNGLYVALLLAAAWGLLGAARLFGYG
ncbi:VTT domain-containing protein [Natrialba sp. INN-245]|uniref:DedA family protein n=1 Tax=Natrialba sp. INN-245 TaxID=2690967 RepID=UPI0013118D48|nr:VTT domain-containing protein [Natrialba sp. INN-245]MWV39794.1 membrane-associated protein [Natrialba sp. INN-245]